MMAFDGQQVFCGNNTQYLGNKLAQGGEMYTFAAVRFVDFASRNSTIYKSG